MLQFVYKLFREEGIAEWETSSVNELFLVYVQSLVCRFKNLHIVK